jgi:hypothetical protein
MNNLYRKILPENIRKKVNRKITDVRALLNRKNLNFLGTLYKTDKWGSHWYTQHYQFHFEKFRNKPIKVLEIGVGGYENPEWGGESLRMWKAYFKNASIYSIDIHDKSLQEEHRIKIYRGSQVDEDLIKQIISEVGEFDIIIDDGSHLNRHVIKSFELLFPHLKKGGIYALEDLQTSYYPQYGGDSKNLNNPSTSINFLKKMIDSLNYQEFINPGYEPSYFDKNIVSAHFYHNLAFIYKNDNLEESNMVKNNIEIEPGAGKFWD